MAAMSSAGQRVSISCALCIPIEYCVVARGFESKDVEFQQAEAERQKTFGPALTREEREAQSKRATIELALARARADLQAARTPAHKRMLTQAIAALEQQLVDGIR